VNHAAGLAIRRGPWKLLPANRSGTGKRGKPGATGGDEALLYHLPDDLGETKNVAGENPGIVKEMTALLGEIREKGRSRP